MLKQLKAGLSALEDALEAGFEDFKVTTTSSFDIQIILLALGNLGGSCESITLYVCQRVRTDPDLSNIRTLEEFEPLVKRFDESFINENAINAIKSLFGFKT